MSPGLCSMHRNYTESSHQKLTTVLVQKAAQVTLLPGPPCTAQRTQVICSLHTHVLHHDGSLTKTESRAQCEACRRAAPCLSCRRGRCREGRKPPALRAELLQAGEHLVGAPRLRRVQLRVGHHDDRPARITGPRVSSTTAAGSPRAQAASRHRICPCTGLRLGHLGTLATACASGAVAPRATHACPALGQRAALPCKRRSTLHVMMSATAGVSPGQAPSAANAAGPHMPAALPAATPVGASSNTRQRSGAAGGENLAAAARKMSGAGLPQATWSPAARAPACAT